MSSKLKALIYTAAFAVMCGVIGSTTYYLSRFMTPEQFAVGLAVAGFTACFYTIYSLLVSKFEYEDTLKRMVDKK